MSVNFVTKAASLGAIGAAGVFVVGLAAESIPVLGVASGVAVIAGSSAWLWGRSKPDQSDASQAGTPAEQSPVAEEGEHVSVG